MIGIFVADCDCEPGTFELLSTDALATKRAWEHWQIRITRDDNHRYWRVHGPSGHVIGIHNSPVGELPPPPL